MKLSSLLRPAVALLACGIALPVSAAVNGWLSWRGPDQGSVSRETGLPDKITSPSAALWTADWAGQSTAVIADGRLFIMGYEGEGAQLKEGVACFDAETGKLLWKQTYADFLSDTVYSRYATSSPTVDAETGNVYVQGTQGYFAAFSRDGKLLWSHSLMEEFGRLTFPNSRTASPVIDRELVITRGITSSWGAHGAAGDRFYAYDKKTGELVWSSAPGERPQDNTFSQPYLDFWNGKRVLYSAGGDSTILAINARTGEPIWRFSFAKAGAKGGINAGLIRYKDMLIAVHESENLDSSEIGRVAAFRIPKPEEVKPTNAALPFVFAPKALEAWRQPAVGSLASSPVIVGDVIYEVTGTGDLAAVDAETGRLLWKQKLGIEQRQSSPFYADGKLYVAMYTTSQGEGTTAAQTGEAGSTGDLFIIKPSREKCEILSKVTLDGRCYGSPMAYNGKVYLQTDAKLYCFGKAGNNAGLNNNSRIEPSWPAAGPATQLQAIPYEVLLRPGQSQSFRIRTLDANGFTVDESVDPKSVKWETFIPPTALVRATMNGTFNAEGQLVAAPTPAPSAGQFKATFTNATGKVLTGFIKGRVLPDLPLKFDFESAELSNMTTNDVEPSTAFAYPPLPWNSARFRFEVRQAPGAGGTKALTKTIENKLFQRAQVFIGHPDMKNYTIEADVMTEGNSRKMAEVGLICQRYAIILKGNSQQIEVNSNQERVKAAAPFKWAPNEWNHIKARVDVAADGSGVVRAKAWKKGDAEPAAWTIEVPIKSAHANGSPGLFCFTPQDQRAYIDNISVTGN